MNIKNKGRSEQFLSWNTIPAASTGLCGEHCLLVKGFQFAWQMGRESLVTVATHLQVLGVFSSPPQVHSCCSPFSWSLWTALQPAHERSKATWKHNSWTWFIWCSVNILKFRLRTQPVWMGCYAMQEHRGPRFLGGSASQQGCRAAGKVPAGAIPSSGRWRKRIPPTCAELETWKPKW